MIGNVDMKIKTLVLVGLLGGIALPCAAIEQGVNEGVDVKLEALSFDEERIKNYHEEIRSEFERNSNIRFVVKGAGCIAGLAACLMLYNDFSLVTGDELRSMRSCIPVMHAVADHYIFQNNDEVQQALVGVGGKQASTGGWGSFLGRLATQMAFTTFFGYVSQKILSGIFFDQSIQWIVQERTLLPDVEKQLQDIKTEVATLKLGRAHVAHEDCDRYVLTMVSLHNEIAQQLERVIGYIGYKVSTFPVTEVGSLNVGDTAAGYLKGRIQAVTIELNKSLAAYKNVSKNDERILIISTMFDTIQLFMNQIKSNVSQFELLEKKMRKAA